MGEVLLPIKPKFTFRAADGYPPHCGIKLDTWDNHFSAASFRASPTKHLWFQTVTVMKHLKIFIK